MSQLPQEPTTQIEDLEKAINFQKEQITTCHRFITYGLSALTALIAFVTIGQGILSWSSKRDVDEAIRQMKNDFKELSGEAIKKPRLTISTRTGILAGQSFEIANGAPLPFIPLFLENSGDRSTDPITVRLFCSDALSVGDEFQPVTSNDKDYHHSYYLRSTEGARIAAKETWVVEPTVILNGTGTNFLRFKLVVYYGLEDPVEAKFTAKLK